MPAPSPTFSASGGAVIPSSTLPYDPKTGGMQKPAGQASIPTQQTPEQRNAAIAAASTPSPTLTANTANVSPSKPPSSSPPAVLTSSAATDHINNISSNLSTLHNDAATQKANIAATQAAQTGSTEATGQDTAPQNDTGSGSSDLDKQISDILGQMETGIGNIEDSANATTTDENGNQVSVKDAIAQNTADELAEAKLHSDKLAQIAAGTYPLSPSEQALLSSTTNAFNQTIQAQMVANQAYVGKITAAMASLGINVSAPTSALGTIYNAISVGTSKIADLDTKMATAVSKLQDTISTQNYKSVQDDWSNLSKAFGDREKALQDLQKNVQDAAKLQEKELMDWTKTSISALINTGKFNETQSKNLIDSAYKQGTLDEKTRHDLATEATAAAREARLASNSVATSGGKTIKSGGHTFTPADQSQISAYFNNGGTINGVTYAGRGDDGYIDPGLYKTMAEWWQGQGGQLKDFLTNYPPKYYVNPDAQGYPSWMMPAGSGSVSI